MLPDSVAPTVTSTPTRGLAIAALVLGILSVGLSFLLIGGVLAVVGVVLGLAHLWRARGARGMAVAGLILSVFGFVATAGFGVLYYVIVKDAMGSVAEGDKTREWVGVQSPDFSVTTLDGHTFKLSELRGKRVVVDYWATWCPPCRLEIPHFNQLRDEFSSDELFLVGVSDESETVLRTFLEKNQVRYPVASVESLPAPYSKVVAIPTTFFIDRNGTIQSVLVGYKDFSILKQHSTAEDYQGDPRQAP